MKEIIRWIREVEQLAHETYQCAAERFSDDADFSAFLSELAEDEAFHFHLVGSAEAIFGQEGEFPAPAVELDEDTRHHVEEPLRQSAMDLRRRQATKHDIVRCVLQAGRSELNALFVYVMRECQKHSRMFQQIAAVVHAHARRVDRWVESLPPDLTRGIDNQALPQVWDRRFLVMEDKEAVRELFREILSRHGRVVVASNGQEAFEKAQKEFFDVIVTDEDMPVMKGSEFLEKARRVDPSVASHVVLCTGRLNPELQEFCTQHGIRPLRKPVRVRRLVEVVQKIVDEGVKGREHAVPLRESKPSKES